MQQLVGPHFNVQTMRDAQQWALAQLAIIAAEFTPGMLETDAQTLLCQRLAQAGVDTHWHPAIVRFGANTCKIYSEPSDPTVRLGENDVFFIDIGPVWHGHEADVGATYAVGHDVDAKAIVQAVDQVFAQVEAHWRGGCSGTELYQYAQHCAARHNSVINFTTRSKAIVLAITRISYTQVAASVSCQVRPCRAFGCLRSN